MSLFVCSGTNKAEREKRNFVHLCDLLQNKVINSLRSDISAPKTLYIIAYAECTHIDLSPPCVSLFSDL